MTDENIKEYAKIGVLCSLLVKCETLKNGKVTCCMVEAVKEAAEDYLELCDEDKEANT